MLTRIATRCARFASKDLKRFTQGAGSRSISAVPEMRGNDIADHSVEARWERLALMTQDPTIKQIAAKMKRERPLPKSFAEALEDNRAIVITSTDGRVVDVNDAWVNLCGYTREAALNRSLGELLHGAETERDVANSLLHQLQADGMAPYYEAVLTNYTSDGRKFRNLVKVKAIHSVEGKEYFMGVLQDISKRL